MLCKAPGAGKELLQASYVCQCLRARCEWVVAAKKHVVRTRDGEQQWKQVGDGVACRVEPEPRQVGRHVHVAHRVRLLEGGLGALDAARDVGQEAPAVGYDDLHAGEPAGNVVGDHVEHGARRVGEELVERSGARAEHAFRDRLGTARVDETDDIAAALLRDGLEAAEKRVEALVAEVEPSAVAGELDAKSVEVFDCACGLDDCSIDIGQGHDGAEPKAVGMPRNDAGRLVVESVAKGCRLCGITKEWVRGGKGQNLVANVHLVKEREGAVLVPNGEREAVLTGRAMGFQEAEVALRQDVAVDVDHETLRLSCGLWVQCCTGIVKGMGNTRIT